MRSGARLSLARAALDAAAADYPDQPRELAAYLEAYALAVAALRFVAAGRAELDAAARALNLTHDTELVGAWRRRQRASQAAIATLGPRVTLLALALALHDRALDDFRRWRATRAAVAARFGAPPPPVYVLPEDRGDAWEPSPAPSAAPPGAAAPPALRELARASLRTWARVSVLAACPKGGALS